MNTPSIFIDGEAGTTGLGIRERLAGLPVALRSLPEAQRKDAAARRAMMAQVDVVVLCLPDAAAKESVALADELGERSPRIVDASTAHRVAPGWVYGFAEMAPGQARAIAQARRVANPGCYPSGAIALLRPLVDAGLMAPDQPVTVNAVSGYSGGGKALIAAHEASGGPAFNLYGLGLEHKHVPELQQNARLTRRPIFVPSVTHIRQGMIVSVPLHLDTLPGRPTAADLHDCLTRHYAGAELVAVAPGGSDLDIAELVNTDRMILRVHANERQRHAVLTASLDNLGKGASGAAVQSIALMLGLAAHAHLGAAVDA
ncbi:MAG: N-acetyl-gamma-glutamyl-phosphate reductase [Rhodospirillales bacterium]|nr:N-acetyl-gamma-glutamyl-phosphate reductase [Rhodospirillales bacterium]